MLHKPPESDSAICYPLGESCSAATSNYQLPVTRLCSCTPRALMGKPANVCSVGLVVPHATSQTKATVKCPFSGLYLFKNFEKLPTNLSSLRPGRLAGDPAVTDIQGILYNSSESVEVKLRHTDDWMDLCARRPRGNMAAIPSKLYAEPLKISSIKFRHLQELKKLMPGSDDSLFYDSLPHE